MTKIEIDSKALDYRIYVHDNFSKSNFDGWVLEKLNPKVGMRVLDVGCGSGKHLFEIAQKVGATGSVLGMDTSTDSLKKCRQKIESQGVKNVSVQESDLAEIGEKLTGKLITFDRVLSSFAIYYTKNPSKTFSDLHGLLKNRGELFICGPTKKNNLEFLELVKEAGGTFSDDFLKWSEFLEHEAVNLLKQLFSKVEIEYFENPIEFPDAETLFKYWQATPLYKKEIEGRMRELIGEKFKQKNTFTTNKVIIGITCQKI